MTKHATSVVAQLRVVGADAGLDLLPRDRRRNRVDVHLRSEFRCVALDHIGFGLSSRSARREDHRPESHARRLAALLDNLDLRDHPVHERRGRAGRPRLRAQAPGARQASRHREQLGAGSVEVRRDRNSKVFSRILSVLLKEVVALVRQSDAAEIVPRPYEHVK